MTLFRHDLLLLLESLRSADGLAPVREVVERLLQELTEAEAIAKVGVECVRETPGPVRMSVVSSSDSTEGYVDRGGSDWLESQVRTAVVAQLFNWTGAAYRAWVESSRDRGEGGVGASMMTNDESVAGVARLTAQGGSSHRPASDVDESARPITELETPSLPRSRRPVASRVRHGQPSCADYGCTRAQCVEAARKARRERSLERLQGRVGHVDSASACGYVSLLRDRGMSAQDIADRSGVSVTLVRRLLKQAGLRPGRIARATEEAVLGVPVPAPHQSMLLAGRGLVDASNVTWLLTDLARRGW